MNHVLVSFSSVFEKHTSFIPALSLNMALVNGICKVARKGNNIM